MNKMTTTETRILSAINQAGAIQSIRWLCTTLGISRTNARTRIRNLQKRGLIQVDYQGPRRAAVLRAARPWVQRWAGKARRCPVPLTIQARHACMKKQPSQTNRGNDSQMIPVHSTQYTNHDA